MCCYWGQVTLNCLNADKLRFQLCTGLYTTRNHRCVVNHCRSQEGKECSHRNVTYINCKRTHYAMLPISLARKQAINLARSRKNEWRMVELEREKRREEKETAAKAKEAEGRIQVAATTKIGNESERPVKRDRDDGDLGMRDKNKRCKDSRHTDSPQLNGEQQTPLTIRVVQHKCNHSHAICMTAFEGAKSVRTDIVWIQEPYLDDSILFHQAFDTR